MHGRRSTAAGRLARLLVTGLLAATVAPVAATSVATAQDACTTERVSGTGRVETAAAISAHVRDEATDVVLARADAYPDALAAVPLAHALDAPLLLTGGSALSAATATEIERLGATQATILGGAGAISAQVGEDLRDLGLQVTRIEGTNRFETAAAVAAALPGPLTEAVVVEGANGDPRRGWPDAVVAGPLAAASGAPVLMVTSSEVPSATFHALNDLGIERVTVVGGTASVGHPVLDALADPDRDGTWDRRTERVSGPDRYTTSTEVAWEQDRDGATPETLWLATGRAFPDALAAGAAAAATGGAVLLVDGRHPLADEAAATYRRDRPSTPSEVVVTGGPAAVSDAILGDAPAMLCDGQVPTPDLGANALDCAPGGLANHRRMIPSQAMADTWQAHSEGPTAETGLAFMRAAGPFTAQFDSQPDLRTIFVDWIDRIKGISGAYHESLHGWQHAGAGPYTGTLRSCLALDEQQRGQLSHDMPEGAPPPSVIKDVLLARGQEVLDTDSFQYRAFENSVAIYIDCDLDPDQEFCASSNERTSSLLGELHAYVTGYELQWALIEAGAVEPPAPGGSASMDGGWAVIPATAMYLRHLRQHDPALWQVFVDLNGPALAELWRMYEDNWPGPLADDDGGLWDLVFGGGLVHEIALATSGRAGAETPARPS